MREISGVRSYKSQKQIDRWDRVNLPEPRPICLGGWTSSIWADSPRHSLSQNPSKLSERMVLIRLGGYSRDLTNFSIPDLTIKSNPFGAILSFAHAVLANLPSKIQTFITLPSAFQFMHLLSLNSIIWRDELNCDIHYLKFSKHTKWDKSKHTNFKKTSRKINSKLI